MDNENIVVLAGDDVTAAAPDTSGSDQAPAESDESGLLLEDSESDSSNEVAVSTETTIVFPSSIEVSNLYEHSFMNTSFENYTVSEGLLLLLIVLFLARSIIRVISGKGV